MQNKKTNQKRGRNKWQSHEIKLAEVRAASFGRSHTAARAQATLQARLPRNNSSSFRGLAGPTLSRWKSNTLSVVPLTLLPSLTSLSDYRRVTRLWKTAIDGTENIKQRESSSEIHGVPDAGTTLPLSTGRQPLCGPAHFCNGQRSQHRCPLADKGPHCY